MRVYQKLIRIVGAIWKKYRNPAELCCACLLPPTFRTRRCRSPGVWHTVPCLANGYLETSFLPGRHFSAPDDFNTQLLAWLKVANRRVHRTLGTRPAGRWEADRGPDAHPARGRPADLVAVLMLAVRIRMLAQLAPAAVPDCVP